MDRAGLDLVVTCVASMRNASMENAVSFLNICCFLFKICIQSKLTVAKYFLFLVDLCYDVYCGNFEKCDLYQGKCGKIFSFVKMMAIKQYYLT